MSGRPAERSRQRGMAPWFLILITVLTATEGCGRQRDTNRKQSPGGDRPADTRPVPRAGPPQRPIPTGRPAPSAQCGHAVAFAGWRPDGGGTRDVLLVCDPGDNSLAEVGHAWAPTPRDLPIHFGRQRPSVVLQPAGAFTVTGAIVVAPRRGRPGAPRMQETRAAGMPDLSQDFSPRWPGLCGPTSAADVLFSIGERHAAVLAGRARGPGAEADAGVALLIAGGMDRIAPESLAGRMGVRPDGDGATNEGMRRGLEAWLDEFAPDEWQARLDWFDDAAGERTPGEQREFFGRLAAATEAGGGAVLCLWPGTEFADEPVDPAAAQLAAGPEGTDAAAGGDAGGGQAPPLPDAAFPELPPAARQEPTALPGRPEATDPRAAAAAAAKKLDSARRRLERGGAARAYEEATEAVALLHQAARRDPDLRARLAEARELCRECEARIPARSRLDSDKHTQFD